MLNLRKILHAVTLRLPQSIALRNGLRVNTFTTSDNALFWGLFTSKEYLAFVPFLIKRGIIVDTVVDCGAACGYFSLLIEHLCRTSVLPWSPNYICVEPSTYNFRKLAINFEQNLFSGRVELHKGLVGKRDGKDFFFESRTHPWSSSIASRKNIKSNKTELHYVDIERSAMQKKSLLKLDVEGAEFEFLQNYDGRLNFVEALIIEWHHEFGDKQNAVDMLEKNGLYFVHRSTAISNRTVELYLRTQI
jgi:FkbM family methyltransferase